MNSLFKLKILSILSLTMSHLLNAQDFKIGFQSSIGKYKMSDLRGLNSNILTSTNIIGARLISNYPQYYYFQPSIVLSYKRFNLGVLYSQQSSGSRISVKDYSGEYRFDSKIKSTSLGVLGGVNLNPKNKLKFSLYSELGTLNTKLYLTEFLKVYDQTITDKDYDYFSKNYYIEPGLNISYPLYFVSFEINLGYCKQFGKQKFEDKNEKKLTNFHNDELKPDWSGLRFGLTIYLVFPLKTKVKSDI